MNITQESEHMFSNLSANYEKIKHWSVIFGAPVFNSENIPSYERINLMLNLIKEETKELEEELLKENPSISKAELELGDLLWVVYRGFMELGINPNEVIDRIYNANMSKACKTKEEAQLSVNSYREGVHPQKPGVKIEAYFEYQKGLYIIKDSKTNKILKSINTIKP
jgi:NTP pyrophosphatase (non-canonical NTP hydrolase)